MGGIEVDFLWSDERLVVETDGFRYHRGRLAFERDRDRDLALRTHGYEVLRLSYRQVTEEERLVAAVLRERLPREPGRSTDGRAPRERPL